MNKQFIKIHDNLYIDLSKAKGTHKYIKRMPHPNPKAGRKWIYFYTQKQVKDFKEKGVVPGEEKKEKGSILSGIMSFFGFKSEKQAAEKVNAIYSENKQQLQGVDKGTFADHMNEYLSNKEKWDARLSGEKKEKGEKKEAEPKTEKPKSEEQGEKKPSGNGKKWDMGLMRKIAGMVGGGKEGEEKKESSIEEKFKNDFFRNKEIDDKIREVKIEADKKIKELFPYSKESKDFIGRATSHDSQIESTVQMMNYLKDKPNFGFTPKDDIKKEIDKLEKRTKISADNKEKLKKLKNLYDNYESELKKRKDLADAVAKREEILNDAEKKQEPLKKEQEKLQKKITSNYSSLSSEEKQAIRKLKDDIDFGRVKPESADNFETMPEGEGDKTGVMSDLPPSKGDWINPKDLEVRTNYNKKGIAQDVLVDKRTGKDISPIPNESAKKDYLKEGYGPNPSKNLPDLSKKQPDKTPVMSGEEEISIGLGKEGVKVKGVKEKLKNIETVETISGKSKKVDLSKVTITDLPNGTKAFWDSKDNRIILSEEQKKKVLSGDKREITSQKEIERTERFPEVPTYAEPPEGFKIIRGTNAPKGYEFYNNGSPLKPGYKQVLVKDKPLQKASELSIGTKVESEHDRTIKFIADYLKKNNRLPSNEEIHKSIAKDHLAEIPDYYTRLNKMESEAEKKMSKAVNALEQELQKGKAMPIGTISNGRKKVAEGKWVPVKDGKEKGSVEQKKYNDSSGREYTLGPKGGVNYTEGKNKTVKDKDKKEKKPSPDNKEKKPGEKKPEEKGGLSEDKKSTIKNALKKMANILAEALSGRDVNQPTGAAIEETGTVLQDKSKKLKQENKKNKENK